MERRDFTKNIIASAGLVSLPSFVKGSQSQAITTPQTPFKLKYAPHFGMFANSAGKDEIDQLKFMHEMGFRALEDNGMMGKTPELQSKIGETMAKLGMSMGVFVVGFDNWPPKSTLTTGNKEWRNKFLTACKTAVEVQNVVMPNT
jgi:hydroxypyruvate isomerase